MECPEIGAGKKKRLKRAADFAVARKLQHIPPPGQWSPLNPQVKRKYGRLFLLRLRFVPLSLERPENLPNVEVVLEESICEPLFHCNLCASSQPNVDSSLMAVSNGISGPQISAHGQSLENLVKTTPRSSSEKLNETEMEAIFKMVPGNTLSEETKDIVYNKKKFNSIPVMIMLDMLKVPAEEEGRSISALCSVSHLLNCSEAEKEKQAVDLLWVDRFSKMHVPASPLLVSPEVPSSELMHFTYGDPLSRWNGVRKYERDFILSLHNSPLSLKKPDILSDVQEMWSKKVSEHKHCYICKFWRKSESSQES